ncbi:hypothetical protein DY000_02040769 [Brassica cretica]|uniref:Uncharacterized protein n=1 Tax=Brassica cretica TaxID=69181 RepID=A0ABQ7B9A1_BRACR|nr:hypothetical protein DY000_02040769 [Brassica cretica]
MEGSPYRKFSFSRRKGAVPGTGPEVLHSGDPEAGVLPGSTGVAHSQQASLRQDIAPVILRSRACDGILETAEPGALMFHEEELKGWMRRSRLGDWRESLLEIPD